MKKPLANERKEPKRTNDAAPAPRRARASRDPEGRRAAILSAAADLAAESGVASLTHRAVAARAGVPLGAVAQYYNGIERLRECAVAELERRFTGSLEETSRMIKARGGDARAVAETFAERLSDKAFVVREATVL